MQGIVAGRIEEQLEDAFYSHRDSVLRAALTPEFYAQIPESRVRERIAARSLSAAALIAVLLVSLAPSASGIRTLEANRDAFAARKAADIGQGATAIAS